MEQGKKGYREIVKIIHRLSKNTINKYRTERDDPPFGALPSLPVDTPRDCMEVSDLGMGRVSSTTRYKQCTYVTFIIQPVMKVIMNQVKEK